VQPALGGETPRQVGRQVSTVGICQTTPAAGRKVYPVQLLTRVQPNFCPVFVPAFESCRSDGRELPPTWELTGSECNQCAGDV
jgi:hypothetical protein